MFIRGWIYEEIIPFIFGGKVIVMVYVIGWIWNMGLEPIEAGIPPEILSHALGSSWLGIIYINIIFGLVKDKVSLYLGWGLNIWCIYSPITSSQEKWLCKKIMLGFLMKIKQCLILLLLAPSWIELLNSIVILKGINATMKIEKSTKVTG